MFIDNIPSSYHISKGAEGIFYILNDGDTFVKNLSKDLEEAKIEAKKIVGENVDVSIWTRIYQTKESKPRFGFEPLQRYALPKGYAVNKFDKVFYSIKDFPLFHKSWHSEQIDRTDIADNSLIFGYGWRKNLTDREYNSYKNSQWIGKLKEIVTFKGKIIFKKEVNGYNGKTNLYKFDVNGNVVLTYTPLQLGEINQVVSIKAKVSELDYLSNEYGERGSIIARPEDANLPEDIEDGNFDGYWFWKKLTKINKPKLITEFQADNKIQVSAGKSTNNNPESKTRGENDE